MHQRSLFEVVSLLSVVLSQFPIDALDAAMLRLAEELAEPLPYATEEEKWLGEDPDPDRRTGIGRLAIDGAAALGKQSSTSASLILEPGAFYWDGFAAYGS